MDLAKGQENVVITANEELLSTLSDSFQYSPCNVQGPGCDVDPNLISYEGCECKSSSCVLGSCTCNLKNYKSSRLRSIVEKGFPGVPVYECNSMCKCGITCCNRIVQHGITIQLEVFKTEGKGLGVKSLENISKGQFVCEYAGQIIGTEEAIKRTKQQSMGDMNYIIAVHEFYPSICGDSTKKISTIIDPKNTGNVGRFINHSCDPNLMMVPVRVDSVIPHLALFALRNIQINEELSFSYAGLTGIKDNMPQNSEKMQNMHKICRCGAANCSGFLPFDNSSFES